MGFDNCREEIDFSWREHFGKSILKRKGATRGRFWRDFIIASTPIPINSEIERTAKRLRKQAKLRKKLGEGPSSPGVNIWKDINLSSDSDEEKEENPKIEVEEPKTESEEEEEKEPKVNMGDVEQTLRQLAT
ncbi:hypothetical protein L6452_32090 [Arctium lappa]|uniref:Uncharacterized protein n=1 Tax=Arctium lappa TaxID=4217 RepID=A0ACB8Z4H6_ARCLA|nr:hypothetical protein L6452_32090 [Arctium lappa]